MATPRGALRRGERSNAGHPARSPLTVVQAAAIRTQLVAERAEQHMRFAQHAATLGELAANVSEDATSRERAMAALRLYGARVAIEEIDDALVRIDDGRHGICQSCHRPVPFERLQRVPRARFCADCSHASEVTRGNPITL